MHMKLSPSLNTERPYSLRSRTLVPSYLETKHAEMYRSSALVSRPSMRLILLASLFSEALKRSYLEIVKACEDFR